MKTQKNTRSVQVEWINDLKIIAQYICDNEDYRQQWIETIKEEGWEYGKQSLYYLSKKSLAFSLQGFETKMLKELVESLIQE